MTDLDFGHIKRICESDAGHGMTKTALIHWVLGSISEVERLEADLEEAEQSHYIADLESRIAVVKECLSGSEWQGLTSSGNHRSNVDRAVLAADSIMNTQYMRLHWDRTHVSTDVDCADDDLA